jgi:hypothetical protein
MIIFRYYVSHTHRETHARTHTCVYICIAGKFACLRRQWSVECVAVSGVCGNGAWVGENTRNLLTYVSILLLTHTVSGVWGRTTDCVGEDT